MALLFLSSHCALELLDFLYLDDWYHLKVLCRSTHHRFQRLRTRIYNIVLRRTLAFLAAMYHIENLDGFFQALFDSNAFLMGSFLIEILLGQAKFQANDMDIFFPSKRKGMELAASGFSAIQTWCFRWSTYTSDERCQIQENLNVANISHADVDFEELEWYLSIQHHDACITGVYNYQHRFANPCANIQCVELSSRTVCETKGQWDGVLMQFAEQAPDFECCKGRLRVFPRNPSDDGDGNWIFDLHLPRYLSQLAQRQLVVLEERDERMIFHNPCPFLEKGWIKKRLRKYERRGFQLHKSLMHFGAYFKHLQNGIIQGLSGKMSFNDAKTACDAALNSRKQHPSSVLRKRRLE